MPLQQPSKAASSHSSVCTNSRQRSPGFRKPHLLPSCFYLSLHCISCPDCRSEKPEISLYLCDCQSLTKKCTSCMAVFHQQFGLTQVRVGAGVQAAFPITSKKPAFLLHNHTEKMTLLFLSLPVHVPVDDPKTLVFLYSSFTNPRHLFSDFAWKRQIFMCPWVFLRN